jgi:hypothetical protein
MISVMIEDLTRKRELEDNIREIKDNFLARKREIIEIICECFAGHADNYWWNDRFSITTSEYNAIMNGENTRFYHQCGMGRALCDYKLSSEKDFFNFFPFKWFFTSDEEIRSSLLQDIAEYRAIKIIKDEEKRIRREQKKEKKLEILNRFSPEEKKVVGLIKKKKSHRWHS